MGAVKGLKRCLQVLRSGRSFALLLHVRPDGDSVGSSLALGLGLKKLGKEVLFLRADEMPENLRFLLEASGEDFLFWEEARGRFFDVAVCLDCSDPRRVGPAEEILGLARTVVNIDHHLSNARFGDVSWVDPGASAAGEMVFRLLKELRVRLDYPIALAIYTSLVTDTGSFRYENTSPEAHLLAGELIGLGVRPEEVARKIWEEKPLSSFRLLCRALERMEVLEKGRVALIALSREDYEDTGAGPWESEGVVNYGRMVRGVEAAFLLSEEESGEVRVSIRTRAPLDASRLAARLGGGGHARAAGCTLPGSLSGVRARVLEAVREALSAEGAELAASRS